MAVYINKDNFFICFQEVNFTLSNGTGSSDVPSVLEKCKALFAFYQGNKGYFPGMDDSLQLLRVKLKNKVSAAESDILDQYDLRSPSARGFLLPYSTSPLPDHVLLAQSYIPPLPPPAIALEQKEAVSVPPLRSSTPPPPPPAIALEARRETPIALALFPDPTVKDEAVARASLESLDYRQLQERELNRYVLRHQARLRRSDTDSLVSNTSTKNSEKKPFLCVAIGALTALVVLILVYSLSKSKK